MAAANINNNRSRAALIKMAKIMGTGTSNVGTKVLK
jgi:hypothetical protein